MASIALLNRVLGSKAAAPAAEPTFEADDRFSVRAIPNEDIYLFVKEIDNSRVVRESDPKARTAAWRLALTGAMIVALLIVILVPNAYARIAGYRIESLKQEQAHLLTEKARLDVEEQALLTPQRLQLLADQQKLVDPGPEKFVYLETKAGAIALNAK